MLFSPEGSTTFLSFIKAFNARRGTWVTHSGAPSDGGPVAPLNVVEAAVEVPQHKPPPPPGKAGTSNIRNPPPPPPPQFAVQGLCDYN